ncbi:MAG: DUF1573 domain-containing protein [Desulfobacterales bacterium]|nr:DUF1573 domain-containing protein [Desulfobacterales bacterium]
MKARTIIALIAAVGVLGWASMAICADAPTGAAKDATGPAVYFPAKIFEFQPVLGGKEVVHDFVVRNKGDAELKIEKVKTG